MNDRATGVSVRGLTKRFGQVQALAGLDLEVATGELVAVLGENGAGKSTLLRILGTTVLPDAGAATVAGFDVVTSPDQARRSTGLVIGDERAWYWRLTGRQNLEFFARLWGWPAAKTLMVVDELLVEVGLVEAADRRVDGYSAGMRARLAVARAMVGDPPVLLLDEPTRALDPVAAVAFRTTARRHIDQGRAILATHDLHEAADLASRIVVMHRGRIAARAEAGVTAAELQDLLLEVGQ